MGIAHAKAQFLRLSKHVLDRLQAAIAMGDDDGGVARPAGLVDELREDFAIRAVDRLNRRLGP